MYSSGAVSCSVVGAMMILFTGISARFSRSVLLWTAVAWHTMQQHRFDGTGPMSVQALGYIGLRAKELGDWATFGSDFLGLQRIDKTRSSMAFRMDDRKQRIVIDADGGQGIGFFGWEVADAAALEALGARLEAAGVKVARGARALADERHVKDLIVFQDPAG